MGAGSDVTVDRLEALGYDVDGLDREALYRMFGDDQDEDE